jgi:hypothetical protein
MSKVTAHFSEHLFAWMTTAVLTMAAAGVLGYLNLLHVQRGEYDADRKLEQVQRVEDQIDMIDLDINEKDFYNQFGSAANKEARLRIIAEQKTRKSAKVRQWEKLTGADYKGD